MTSAGHWTHWPTHSDRHDLLASAFAAGQADLTIAPDPRLLALPDPSILSQMPRSGDSQAYGDYFLGLAKSTPHR